MAARVAFPLLVIMQASLPLTVHACDSCGCRMPSELTPTGPGLQEGISEQLTDFSTLQLDGRRIGNPSSQDLQSATTQLVIGYRANEWLSVSGFIPYVSRTFRRPDGAVTQTGTVQGLGDSTLLAGIRIYRSEQAHSAASVSLLAGVRLPTGSPSELSNELNAPDDSDPTNATGGHDLALGSGAYDLIGGVSAIGRLERWFVSVQGTYTKTTEGAYRYRYANEVAASWGTGYFLYVVDPWRLSAQVNILAESKGLDSVAGQKTTDTANHNLFVGPEASLVWRRHLASDLALDLPVYERNSDLQLVPTWRIRGSLSWLF